MRPCVPGGRPRPSGRGNCATAAAVLLVAACSSVPTAPTPPTGRLLTTAVWPGESVLVVSPKAASAPAESVWVTAGTDTLPVGLHDDSTLAVATSDTLPSTDLMLTVHTPGGLATVGPVHVYGYVSTTQIPGMTGIPLPFPGAMQSPTVVLFNGDGPVVVNVETGAESPMPGPSPTAACPYGVFVKGLGPSYRVDSGWVAGCTGVYRLVAASADSIPSTSNARLVAEIGPQTLLAATTSDLATVHVNADSTTSITAISGMNSQAEINSFEISPRGDRAVGATVYANAWGSAPGLPVFASDGSVSYMLFGAARRFVQAAFSPAGDTLFVSSTADTSGAAPWLSAFAAADGTALDSVELSATPARIFADASSQYLYAAETGPVGGYLKLWVVDRTIPKVVAALHTPPACVTSYDWLAIVAAPGHHAVFVVSATAVPYYDNATLGPLWVCRFDVP